MISIEGDEALAGFRAGLTGRRGLDLLRQCGGRALIELPVGVGKSRLLDAITLEAVAGGHYDLVVVLAPTRLLIEERGPLLDQPPGARVVNIRPRPAEDCGQDRDREWGRHEAADLGALGRAEICSRCPRLGACFWPSQYGRELKGARIVYATHAHLERSPGFLARLRSWVGADRVLTLVDEFDFAGKSFATIIEADDLARFADALDGATPHCAEPAWGHGDWVALVDMLRGASTVDLQQADWRMPPVRHDWAAAVQRAGVDRHGAEFRFTAYRLAELFRSPVETRRRGEAGRLEFGTRPYIGDCLIFTGTAGAEFARYRLGRDIGSPFADHRFAHPGTRWSNIASSIGSRHNFPGNADRILDFFARLTARRAADGRRVLLVSKKDLVSRCSEGLASRFADLGADLVVRSEGWSAATLADPRLVPLISYGMIGTNLFEGFDCAYCLNSYYIDEHALDQCLQDLTRRDLRLPIRLEIVGEPRRRRAVVADPAHRDYDIARLARPAHEFKEHGVVVQAVGRVRPFTRPREVITFQMAELPGVHYHAEFRTLGAARESFGVPKGGESRRAGRIAHSAALRSEGHTQAEVADLLGVSERTIRNYEKEDRQKSIF